MTGRGYPSRRFPRGPAWLALLLVAGCGKQFPANSELGRWQIIPASGGAPPSALSAGWFAWRLDTKSGQVEFCTYLAAAPAAPTISPAAGSLRCSAPIQAVAPHGAAPSGANDADAARQIPLNSADAALLAKYGVH